MCRQVLHYKVSRRFKYLSVFGNRVEDEIQRSKRNAVVTGQRKFVLRTM